VVAVSVVAMSVVAMSVVAMSVVEREAREIAFYISLNGTCKKTFKTDISKFSTYHR